MIYIVKTINDWGQEQGTYTATTSKKQVAKAIRQYMHRFKLEFRTSGFNSSSIAFLLTYNDISTLNTCLQSMEEKNKESHDCWLLTIECWNGREVDESWI